MYETAMLIHLIYLATCADIGVRGWRNRSAHSAEASMALIALYCVVGLIPWSMLGRISLICLILFGILLALGLVVGLIWGGDTPDASYLIDDAHAVYDRE